MTIYCFLSLTLSPPLTANPNSFTVAGHVNRAALVGNNGFHTKTRHVDNENSSSRAGIESRTALSNDLTLGANLMINFKHNKSDELDLSDKNTPFKIKRRKIEILVNPTKLGTFLIGHGPMRSDTTSENDLSGTDMVALGASLDSMAGGIKFRESARDTTGPAIEDVYTSMDGLGRRNRVRYDSPSFDGWSTGFSRDVFGSQDVNLNYEHEIQQTKIEGAVSLAKEHQHYRQLNSSVAILHQSGLSFSCAAGRRFAFKTRTQHPIFTHAKLGYQTDLCDAGKSCIAMDIGIGHHFDQKHDRLMSPGIFLVQNINKLNSEIYVGFRKHHLKRKGSGFKDIKAMMIGGRVRF